MSKNLYMHTINGRPAMYQRGTYICYINQWNRVKASEMFVGSLSTIKRQQEASRKWRLANGISEEPANKYGYIRIGNDL